MSLKKNVIVESEFTHLFDFKDTSEEDNHNASMLMFKFLSEVQQETDGKNISRKKLAELIGTSASNITQLFRGNRLINLLTLAKLERILNIEFEISTVKEVAEKKTEIESENIFNSPNNLHWELKNEPPQAIVSEYEIDIKSATMIDFNSYRTKKQQSAVKEENVVVSGYIEANHG